MQQAQVVVHRQICTQQVADEKSMEFHLLVTEDADGRLVEWTEDELARAGVPEVVERMEHAISVLRQLRVASRLS